MILWLQVQDLKNDSKDKQLGARSAMGCVDDNFEMKKDDWAQKDTQQIHPFCQLDSMSSSLYTRHSL